MKKRFEINGIKCNKMKPICVYSNVNSDKHKFQKPNLFIMKTTKNITLAQLKEMLLNWNHGAQPVSIQYVTSPTLVKEGKEKFGAVTKIANIGAMVGYSYENSVNNQRERENELRNFMAQQLWKGKGKRLSTALTTHVEKGTFYLTYKKQQTFKSFHFDAVLNFIPMAILRPYFRPYTPPANQGVEKVVHHREIALENIRKFKFKKVTYNIVGAK
jgi:hypothetical protein